jgi:hypothetical protein
MCNAASSPGEPTAYVLTAVIASLTVLRAQAELPVVELRQERPLPILAEPRSARVEAGDRHFTAET